MDSDNYEHTLCNFYIQIWLKLEVLVKTYKRKHFIIRILSCYQKLSVSKTVPPVYLIINVTKIGIQLYILHMDRNNN